MSKDTNSTPVNLPVLPLRDVVVYPHMVIPLFVGRLKSIKALESAMAGEKQIYLIAQKNSQVDNPGTKDMYEIGTVSTILQLLRLPDGTVKVLVEGNERAQFDNFSNEGEHLTADINYIDKPVIEERAAEVWLRSLTSQFEQCVKLNKKIPPEVLTSLSGINDPGRLIDMIAAHMPLKLEDKQIILESISTEERANKMLAFMEREIDLLQVEKRIRGRVKRQMEKSQREYYLNEQMKAIQKELGHMDEGVDELEQMTKNIAKSGMPKSAKEKATAELNKLKMMSPMSAEATVSRNYLDWILSVPWKKKAKVNNDLVRAQAVLDQDHYGLDKVKERIVEYLAVQQRVKKLKGQVLCLVGPPGVGKTSLGQSIAKATGRKFVRMALGGVRDEAEIRGHRKTYIGAMPGKIIQKLSKVGQRNPLFLLDEVDKMAMDFRGDPASALLEVLDPEQNDSFNDHYLEVDYDLSDVMFVTTANSLNMPGPLLDRMEIIRLAGYTEEEKLNIATRHLIPKQIDANGLTSDEIVISEDVAREVVQYYTREAGVRSLEREIAKICRKAVKELLTKEKTGQIIITPENLEDYLGIKKFRYGVAEEGHNVGQVYGLAWTEVGGELLTIEAVKVAGKGSNPVYTGKLGEVMQESIKAAMTVVRSRVETLGIEADFYETTDMHIHVPEGATPKDGPSAGIAMCTAIVSALTQIPVRHDVAMTGEITLRGEVLPIGGLKEKLLAAHRGKIKTVIIPHENERDLKEIPENIKQDLEIKPVRWVDQVLEIALQYSPKPLDAKPGKPGLVEKGKGKSSPLDAH